MVGMSDSGLSLALRAPVESLGAFGRAVLVPEAPRPVSPQSLAETGRSPFELVGSSGGGELRWNSPVTSPIDAAYRVYQDVPEVKSTVRKAARVVARCRFFPVEEVLNVETGEIEEVESTDPDVLDAFAQWQHPNGSPRTNPFKWAQHWQIAGKVWIAAMPRPDNDRQWEWRMLPANRVRRSRKRKGFWEIRPKNKWVEISDDQIYLDSRMDESPATPGEPDSWVLGLAPIALQLLMLDDLIAAITSSQINFGIVTSSYEWISGRESSNISEEEAKEYAEQFRKKLAAEMQTWQEQRRNGHITGPMVMLGAAEHMENAIKHESVRLEFHKMLVDLQKMYIDRLAGGMDGPREEMSGKGEMNQWNAYEARSDFNENTNEPIAEEYAWHVTTAVVRAWLCSDAYGWTAEEAMKVRIACDAGGIKARQDLSRSSQAVHDRVPVSEQDLAALNGLDPDHVLTDLEERRQWLIMWLVRRAPVHYSPLVSLLPEFEGLNVVELLASIDGAEVRAVNDAGGTESSPSTDPSNRGQEPSQVTASDRIQALTVEIERVLESEDLDGGTAANLSMDLADLMLALPAAPRESTRWD